MKFTSFFPFSCYIQICKNIWEEVVVAARSSPTLRLIFPTGMLNKWGHDHAPFIILSLEGQKHHIIFHKNNLNFWLETAGF